MTSIQEPGRLSSATGQSCWKLASLLCNRKQQTSARSHRQVQLWSRAFKQLHLHATSVAHDVLQGSAPPPTWERIGNSTRLELIGLRRPDGWFHHISREFINTNVSGKKINLSVFMFYSWIWIMSLWHVARYWGFREEPHNIGDCWLCSKLELTVDFLVDCSPSFYVHSDIFPTYIVYYVLGETHWRLKPWAQSDRYSTRGASDIIE